MCYSYFIAFCSFFLEFRKLYYRRSSVTRWNAANCANWFFRALRFTFHDYFHARQTALLFHPCYVSSSHCRCSYYYRSFIDQAHNDHTFIVLFSIVMSLSSIILYFKWFRLFQSHNHYVFNKENIPALWPKQICSTNIIVL